MFPTPLQQISLTQVALHQLLKWTSQTKHQLNNHLNQLILLLLVVLLVVVGLRDQVGVDRQEAVDMEVDTK
jgi:hypothetical protein